MTLSLPTQAEAEAMIAQRTAVTGRKCGECSLCCLLLDVPEADKPHNDWCRHCRPGQGGCAIYEQRPNTCRAFACAWLVNQSLPDYWFPAQAKMLLDFKIQHTGKIVFRIHVHPQYRDRWREQPYFDDIRRMAYHGLKRKEKPYQTVIVIDGKWTFIVLPHKVIPFSPGLTLRIADDRWEHMPVESEAEALQIASEMAGHADG